MRVIAAWLFFRSAHLDEISVVFELDQDQAVGIRFTALLGGVQIVGPGKNTAGFPDLAVRSETGDRRITGFTGGVFQFK